MHPNGKSQLFPHSKIQILSYCCIGFLVVLLACKSTNQKTNTKPSKSFSLNKIKYIVHGNPITTQDIKTTMKLLRYNRVNRNLKKSAEKLLIENILIRVEASKQSIIVNPERIENEIQARQRASGLKIKKFRNKIETETGLSYEQWKQTISDEILKVYFIQTGLNVNPPSIAEVRRFYRNKSKLIGFEVSYREIILPIKKNDFQSELTISKQADRFYKQVVSNPKRFVSLAKKIKNNIAFSGKNPSFPPYLLIHSIAQQDIIVASILEQTKEGTVSKPFRDNKKRYRVIYIEDKRKPPFAKVSSFIQQRIFFERASKRFDVWLAKQKKTVNIIRL